MTRNRPLKIRILTAFSLSIAVLTILIAFAAPAQQAGTAQSAKPSVAVPPDASTSAQEPNPALPGVDGAAASPVARSHTKRHSASAMDSGTLFLSAVTYATGDPFCFAIAVADVNGDGKPDLVVGTNDGGGNGMVVVLLGNGDGTFRSPVSYSSGGGGAESVAVTDVNGDGKPDVVVANRFSNTVGVLLGNGDGTFQPAVTYSGGISPQSVAVADLNGDNEPDIVVANLCCSNEVSVLLGNGDGTFQAAATYDTGGQNASSVAVADVNGDGKPDILVANSYNDTVGVLLGNGDGTFQPAKTYYWGFRGFGADIASLAVADLNGDNKLDLVVADVVGGTYKSGILSVLLGNGDGTFQASKSYASGGTGPDSVAIADVNGDGKPDLLVGNANGLGEGTVGVLLGKGDGTFQAPQRYDSGGFMVARNGVGVADVNGDGKPDLLVANWLSGTVGVLLNNSAPVNSTATTLASSLNPSIYGQTVTFTAAVTSTSGTPTGTVILLDGSTQVGSGTLTNGSVSIAVASLPVGANSMTAKYQGYADFASSTSAPLSQVVNGYSTSTAVSSSLNPSAYGQTVTFTARVTSNSGTPTGTVILLDGSTTVGSGTLTNGSVSIAVASLPVSANSITAAYQGGGGFASSTSAPLTQTVSLATTATALASSLNPAGTNQSVTFTATVTSQFGGATTGSVTFLSGSQTLGTASLSGNTAALTTSFSAAGTYSISAKYSGDGNNTGSMSATLSQVILAATTTTLVSSLNPSVVGQAVTFTATVSSSAGAPPNGETVTFKNGSAVLGTAPLSAGMASLTTSSLPAGIFTITASYAGDANFAASTSAGLRQVVNSTTKSATATTLSSTLNPSIYGQSVTWTATVTTSGSVPPTGTVTFTWGDSIGRATLSASGVASLTRSNLNADSYPLTAVYFGDASNLGSTSAVLTQVITQTTSAATLSSSPNPSTQGEAVTFTATITSPTVRATGPVTFAAGKTVLGTVELSGGKAKFTTSSLAVGSTKVTATYYGDSNIAKSSASVTQTVQP